MVKRGVLIAGHGSRFSFNKGVMEMQADLLRSKGFPDVYIGFNETSIPLIKDALEEMVEDGFDDIVVLPFFVASGLHVTRDIPMKHLGLERNSTGGEVEVNGRKVTIHLEQPFGEDENMTDILCERVEELKTPGKNTYILVMGHGSRLSFNSDIMTLNASRLRERGYQNVFVGYNEFNEPKIEDIILKMMDEGAEEIIALPLFISLGAHLTRDVPAKLGIQEFTDGGIVHRNGRDVEIKYAVPIGGDPRLCDVLVEKLRKYEW